MKYGHSEKTHVKRELDSIATDFYHSFYEKEWLAHGDAVIHLSIGEAYQVQDLVVKKRIASGERVAGFKVGCTSEAIQKQFGISEPINANLFHPHVLDHKVKIDCSSYVHCEIEPEMVLTIGKKLEGRNLSDEELIDSIAYVSPGIEIHEYHFWIEPPTLQALICCGGIHTGLIVGDSRVSPSGLGFQDEQFSVYKDDAQICSRRG